MFEIVMLFAFLCAVTCPLLPAKLPEERLPAEGADSPNHKETNRSLTVGSARRAVTQPQGKLTSRSLKRAHAA
jgi:hypothetical protein